MVWLTQRPNGHISSIRENARVNRTHAKCWARWMDGVHAYIYRLIPSYLWSSNDRSHARAKVTRSMIVKPLDHRGLVIVDPFITVQIFACIIGDSGIVTRIRTLETIVVIRIVKVLSQH